jgi:hypothetical protein
MTAYVYTSIAGETELFTIVRMCNTDMLIRTHLRPSLVRVIHRQKNHPTLNASRTQLQANRYFQSAWELHSRNMKGAFICQGQQWKVSLILSKVPPLLLVRCSINKLPLRRQQRAR